MFYISIDPGAIGAIAVFEDLNLLGVIDLTLKSVGGQKVISIDDYRKKIMNLTNDEEIEFVFIEDVSSRTGQGVKSMFSFGQRFGEAKCLGLTLSENLVFLNPRSWKSSSGLIGKDKSASAKKCASLYPNHSNLFSEKNNRAKNGVKYYDGRGDAVLIGLIGYKGVMK